MNERDNQFSRTDALLDQRWAALGEQLDDIQRIVLMGPTQFADDDLIRRTLRIVVAELYQRRAKRGNDDT